MSIAIKVENLGKSYLLYHQQQEQYATFREAIGRKIRSVFSSGSHSGASSEVFWALNDVSFNVDKGDRIGIIGRNGAGKSTLLKILSRITEPTKGKVSIKGRISSLLEVGTGFHPELTGRENIYLNGSILGMTREEIRNKFDEIVAFAEVEKFLDTPVKRYSSGMYVRLAFAVAAHLEPEILIVDEVLAVGDAEFQKKCLGKMKEVSGEGRTVLFVSHNMGAINSLCNKAILLNSGRVQAMGDTQTITGLYFNGNTISPGEFMVGKGSVNERVIIEKVILRDSNGNVQNNFHFGSDLSVEVELNALHEFEAPYIWIAIKSHRGPVTNASGLIDGFRTSRLEKDKNIIKCTFFNVPLLPGQYTLYMGIRKSDGQTAITDSKDIATFNIVSSLSERGLNNILSDTIASDSVSPVIPYQWEFNDGHKYTFNVKNYAQ